MLTQKKKKDYVRQKVKLQLFSCLLKKRKQEVFFLKKRDYVLYLIVIIILLIITIFIDLYRANNNPGK